MPNFYHRRGSFTAAQLRGQTPKRGDHHRIAALLLLLYIHFALNTGNLYTNFPFFSGFGPAAPPPPSRLRRAPIRSARMRGPAFDINKDYDSALCRPCRDFCRVSPSHPLRGNSGCRPASCDALPCEKKRHVENRSGYGVVIPAPDARTAFIILNTPGESVIMLPE